MSLDDGGQVVNVIVNYVKRCKLILLCDGNEYKMCFQENLAYELQTLTFFKIC